MILHNHSMYGFWMFFSQKVSSQSSCVQQNCGQHDATCQAMTEKQKTRNALPQNIFLAKFTMPRSCSHRKRCNQVAGPGVPPQACDRSKCCSGWTRRPSLCTLSLHSYEHKKSISHALPSCKEHLACSLQ